MKKSEALEIYRAFPRKCARQYAIKCIEKVLQSGEISAEELLKRVQWYARHRKGEDNKYTPHPSTFFNKGMHLDPDDHDGGMAECWPVGPEISADRAWNMVRAAVSKIGSYGTPRDLLPEEVYDAVKEIGWLNICNMGQRDQERMKSRFESIYHGRSGASGVGARVEDQVRVGGRLGGRSGVAGDQRSHGAAHKN